MGASLAGLGTIGGLIRFVLRKMQGHGSGVVNVIGHDIYFSKPELDGNTNGDWGGDEAANVNEPQRHELGGGQGLPLELPIREF